MTPEGSGGPVPLRGPAGARWFRRVLVATDFSPASGPAVDAAISLARATGAQLLVAHAYQDRALPKLGYAPSGSYDDWDRDVRAQAAERLEPIVERARAEGVAAEPLLLAGFPDEAIVEAARQRRADVIVVGTHGRRGAALLLMGSVAQRVVATAGCPVLTVRGA